MILSFLLTSLFIGERQRQEQIWKAAQEVGPHPTPEKIEEVVKKYGKYHVYPRDVELKRAEIDKPKVDTGVFGDRVSNVVPSGKFTKEGKPIFRVGTREEVIAYQAQKRAEVVSPREFERIKEAERQRRIAETTAKLEAARVKRERVEVAKLKPDEPAPVLFSPKAFALFKKREPEIKELFEREAIQARAEEGLRIGREVSPEAFIARGLIERGEVTTLEELERLTTRPDITRVGEDIKVERKFLGLFGPLRIKDEKRVAIPERAELRAQLLDPFKAALIKKGPSLKRLELALKRPKEFRAAQKEIVIGELKAAELEGRRTTAGIKSLISVPTLRAREIGVSFAVGAIVGPAIGVAGKLPALGKVVSSKLFGPAALTAFGVVRTKQQITKFKAEPEFFKRPTGVAELVLEPTLELGAFVAGTGVTAVAIKKIKPRLPRIETITRIKVGKPERIRFVDIGKGVTKEVGFVEIKTPIAESRIIFRRKVPGLDTFIKAPETKVFRLDSRLLGIRAVRTKFVLPEQIDVGEIVSPKQLEKVFGKPLITETGKLIGVKLIAYPTERVVGFKRFKEIIISPTIIKRPKIIPEPTKPIIKGIEIERKVGEQVLIQKVKLEPPKVKKKVKLKAIQKLKQVQVQKQDLKTVLTQKQIAFGVALQKPRLEAALRQEQKQRQKQLLKLGVIQAVAIKPIQKLDLAQLQIPKQRQRQLAAVSIIPEQVSKLKQIVRPIPAVVPAQKLDIVLDIPPPPPPPPLFKLPDLPRPSIPKVKRKKEKIIRPLAFNPSLGAVFDLKVGKRPKVLTGIEERLVPRARLAERLIKIKPGGL